MIRDPKPLITMLRVQGASIPQDADETPCHATMLYYEAASAIEQLLSDKVRLERIVAELGEAASTAGFYAIQAENAAKEAGKRAAYINAKAMNYFDPSFRKAEFA